MATYKVLEDVEIDGEEHKAGDEIELAEEVATQLVTDGKLELADSDEEDEDEEEEED